MTRSNNPIFAEIANNNSCYSIHMKVDAAIADSATSTEDMVLLRKIAFFNMDLDRIHRVAYEALGNTKKVAEIDAWLLKKESIQKAQEHIAVFKGKKKVEEKPSAIVFNGHAIRLPAVEAALPDARREAWLTKHVRQSIWSSAADYVSSFGQAGVPYLKTFLVKLRALQVRPRELDRMEQDFCSEVCTQGPLSQRAQFWKFVGYRIDGIWPKDLVVLVDIETAMWKEYSAIYEKSDEATRLNMDRAIDRAQEAIHAQCEMSAERKRVTERHGPQMAWTKGTKPAGARA